MLDLAVNRFITAHYSVHPLLVLSYDLYRIYAPALNTLTPTQLGLVLCDEGHHLKALDSKVTTALNQCVARRRILMTGTPLQNNLDELYTVVNFVLPGYLAPTLSDFRAHYSVLIDAVKGKTADVVANKVALENELQSKLRPIMLRRTRETILAAILPPRRVCYLFTDFRYGQSSSASSEEADTWQERQYVECVAAAVAREDSEATVDDPEDNNHTRTSSRRKSSSTKDIKRPYGTKKVDLKAVFPILMQARLLCSVGASRSTPTSDSSIKATASGNDGSINASMKVTPVAEEILQCSAKLRLLRDLIQQIRSDHPQDKIIVASAFNQTLDHVKTIAQYMRWSSLRIDGSVEAEKRHKIVRFFNTTNENNADNNGTNRQTGSQPTNPTTSSTTVPSAAATTTNPFFLLLLSQRAGGEGLTLTGANHLVLLDIDWNPAVDAQTMGRVYRQGQSKPVYIYRLVMINTIEETMLRRQTHKDALAQSLLQNPTQKVMNDEQSQDEAKSMVEVDEEEEVSRLLSQRNDEDDDDDGDNDDNKDGRSPSTPHTLRDILCPHHDQESMESNRRRSTPPQTSSSTKEGLQDLVQSLHRHDPPEKQTPTQKTSEGSTKPSTRCMFLIDGWDHHPNGPRDVLREQLSHLWQ